MDIRIRLRPWLESRLNEGWIDGLCWIDREKGIFKIPWKHHSKHTWTEADAAIFKDWAVVTGRYRAGIDDPDWPMWKTRLRCALNKAPDIQEVRQRHNLHCDEPFKVYRFISKTESLWRANATRNASMIFDGISTVQKMAPQNSSNFCPSRFDCPSRSQPVLNRRTALVVQRFAGMDNGPRPVALLQRRGNGVFLKQLPLAQSNPYSRNQQICNVGSIASESAAIGSNNFLLQNSNYSNSVNFSGPNYFGQPAGVIRRISASSGSLAPGQLSSLSSNNLCPFLPDVMEPEFHQLGVRIQHLNVRVKDAIITNPNGCCIYFGRYDEVSSAACATLSVLVFQINSPAAPDPVEAQIPHHVSEANKEYVDLLLDNMVRGIILSVTHGSIFAERMCKCAVFVYVPTANGEYVLLKKLGRREREKLFDYNEFLNDLRFYRLDQRPRPHFEIILAFGQQLRPNLSTSSLLVWCRVASCRAWFQLHKDQSYPVPELYADDFAPDDDMTPLSRVADGTDDSLQCDDSQLLVRPDLMILPRHAGNPMTSDCNGYMPMKMSGLAPVSEHDVAAIDLVSTLESDELTSEQVIEEGVEVPLDDDHEDSIVYDATNPSLTSGLIVTDSHNDPSSVDNCLPSSAIVHDMFLDPSDSAL